MRRTYRIIRTRMEGAVASLASMISEVLVNLKQALLWEVPQGSQSLGP